MAITKSQKEQIVNEVSKFLRDSKFIVFSNFSGVSVSQLTNLRRSLSIIKAKCKVIKKTLLNLVLKKSGDTSFDLEKITGPIGVVFSAGEVIEVAKTLYDFSKKNETFQIIGGLELADNKFLDKDMIITLAKLPSREVLLGNLLAMLTMPLRNLVGILDGVAKKGRS